MQAWYARREQGGTPYRLFALSNLGSMLALLTYPPLNLTSPPGSRRGSGGRVCRVRGPVRHGRAAECGGQTAGVHSQPHTAFALAAADLGTADVEHKAFLDSAGGLPPRF